MEDNASFIPDNIEDFFIINEAGDDVPSSKSENQQAYKMRNMWCPDHPHEETCSAAPRGERKMVVSLPDQGLLDLS